MTFPRATRLGAAGFALAAAVGCSGVTGDERPADLPVESGGTVVVGLATSFDGLLDVTSSSEASQVVIERLFLNLTTVGEDLLTPEPELATGWFASEDGLSVTFQLHPDAVWHDGTPVTAHDVEFTYRLHVHPEVGYPARSWKRSIEDVVVDDDHTVTFRFDRRYPGQVLDASVGVVLPRHLLKDVSARTLARSEFARLPVGNGRFRFVSWEDESITLEATEEHFLGRANLDAVEFLAVPDDAERRARYEDGRLDVCERLAPEAVAAFSEFGRVERFPNQTYSYIGWRQDHPFFESKEVRRAMAMGIDRKAIIDQVYLGHAGRCDGPIHPMLWAFHDALTPPLRDLDGARALLDAAGFRDRDGDGVLERDGRPLAFSLEVNRDNELRVRTAELIAEQLAEIGVSVTPRPRDWGELRAAIVSHEYPDAVLLAWNVGWKVDLRALFHSDERLGPYNHTGYASTEVDDLIDRALAMEDLADAKPLWHEVQTRIVEDQPYAFLYIEDQIVAVRARVHGTVPDVRGFFRNLADWWIPSSKRRSDPA